MTTAIANTSRTCPAWCAVHDDEGGVCLGAAAGLDFRAENRGPGLVAWAEASLGFSPEEGTDVSVSFPNLGSAYMSVDDAEQLANMLRDLVAAARTSTDGEVPA